MSLSLYFILPKTCLCHQSVKGGEEGRKPHHNRDMNKSCEITENVRVTSIMRDVMEEVMFIECDIYVQDCALYCQIT